jgi:hypothetical protein
MRFYGLSCYLVGVPEAPSELSRFVRKVIAALGSVAVAVALILLAGQMPFANSTFEYGKVREFEGTIEARPYPMLWVERPEKVGDQSKPSRYLLVAPGKHGADDLIAAFDGKRVRLNGQLIYRKGGVMVEVAPGTITALATDPGNTPATADLGGVTVTGEIVDSKCYLGVMNPGNGKVHRDCAARCLSGGIPPLFVTSDTGEQFLLAGKDGEPITHDLLREFVAEPVTIRGKLLQKGESQLLQIDVKDLRHTPNGIEAALRRRSQ